MSGILRLPKKRGRITHGNKINRTGQVEFGGESKAHDLGIKILISKSLEDQEAHYKMQEYLEGPILEDRLIIDELSRINPSAYPPGFMGIIADRTYKSTKLPINSIFVTFNTGSLYSVNEVGLALMCRFGIVLKMSNLDSRKLNEFREFAKEQENVPASTMKELTLSKSEYDLLDFLTKNYVKVKIPEMVDNAGSEIASRILQKLGNKQDFFPTELYEHIFTYSKIIALIRHLLLFPDYPKTFKPEPEVAFSDLKQSYNLVLKDRLEYFGVILDFKLEVENILRAYESTEDYLLNIKRLSEKLREIDLTTFKTLPGEKLEKLGKRVKEEISYILSSFRRLVKPYNSELLI